MKLIGNKKGQARVIEAFFASILLFSCLTLIPPQPSIDDSSDNLSSLGHNILLSLDSNGNLAHLISNQNWSSLRSCLESALPLTVWFNLTVYDESMNTLNDFPICNAGSISEKIVSTDYVCASPSRDYDIYVLRLQLSLVE